MIYDKLDYADLYMNLSEGIREGLLFLQNISSDIAIGEYILSPRAKAIVSEYTTKLENENGYEAHRDYIDIQYLIDGAETICCLPVDKVEEKVPYNKEKDIAFFDSKERPVELKIGNGFFAIFYPQDGHKPQLCVDKPMMVKKIVLKIKFK